ncbi:MAG: glycosyltransferase [Bacteroidales bacterium]|nr:glycosyltransferase [Bacteroidales bacterium]
MAEIKDLTIIIPFLNEKEEVENTLKSIRDHSTTDISIIVIDDGSDDGYDYLSVTQKYGATYVRNSERMGVAASRDKGVDLCQTTYFLLLDSHMRFYECVWADRLLSLLQEDDRVILCAQTKVLNRTDEGEVIENEIAVKTYGAFVDIPGLKGITLYSRWIAQDLYPDELVVEIPSVLGAGYAASKRYWQYLQGLRGLIYYGSDEPFISIKAWKEGGRCLLVKDVVIGHIYRTEAPYLIVPIHVHYNKMLIAEMLLPYPMKKRFLTRFELTQEETFQETQNLISKKREEIAVMKSYIRSITTRSDEDVFRMQKSINDPDTSVSLRQLLAITNKINGWGLSEGKCGFAVSMYRKASLDELSVINGIIGELLSELPEVIGSFSLPVTLGYGWCGIGWTISFFLEKKVLPDEFALLLPLIDHHVMERDVRRIRESGFEKGLAGVLYYIMCRLENTASIAPVSFDTIYLQELEVVARDLFVNGEGIDSVDVYHVFLEGRKTGKFLLGLLEEPNLFYFSENL